MRDHEWIAVGVDGSEASRAATRWAAREAQRRGCGLRIVHVYNDYIAPIGFYGVGYLPSSLETQAVTKGIMDAATQEARRTLSAELIETVVLEGDRRAGLIQIAARTAMMVLGDGPRDVLDRVFTGTVTTAVASHATAPVVVVPDTWQDETGDAVVVGIKDYDTAETVVAASLDVASARSARLVVLHAWHALSGYDDAIAAHTEAPHWESQAKSALQGVVDRAVERTAHPTDVEVRVVHGHPASVLAQASADAGLLLVARRAHGFPFGRLGATGRSLLHRSHCPVMVLPAAVTAAAPA